MLKTAAGLLRAESGTISFSEENITNAPRKAAKYIGLMPDPLGVYTDITAHDYLEFFARVLEIKPQEQAARIDEIVEELELGPWLDHEVETLSAGWQRRLALGRILLANSPVLLLDEPAAGLDVSARRELLEIVRRLANKQRAIIISSHILPELEDLADRFGIIDNGQWIEAAPDQLFFTRSELRSGLGKAPLLIQCSEPQKAASIILGSEATESGIRITDCSSREQTAETVSTLCAAGHQVYEVVHNNSNLNELVLEALGANRGTKHD